MVKFKHRKWKNKVTDKLKEIIKEEIVKLPKEAQEAIGAFDWGSVAEEIGKKYLLNESEVNDFQVETMLILFGLEYPEVYKNNIENNVGTTEETAQKMADEAFEKIFKPINDIFVKNIKSNLKTKNPNWKQNLDFVLSGGDYSAFIGEAVNPPILDKEGVGGGNSKSNPPRMTDMRSSFKI